MNIFYRLLILIFLSGMTSAAGIIVFFREASNSIFPGESIIAVVIAAFFLGGAAAAGTAYRFILRFKKEDHILLTVSLLPAFAAFLLISGIIIIRTAGAGTGGANIWTALAVCMAACAPAGFVVFLSYVLSAELLVIKGAGRHANLSPAVFAVGFLAVGIIHSAFLSGGTPNFNFAYWIGIINFAAAYIILREKSKQAGKATAVIVVMLILYLVLNFTGGVKKLEKNTAERTFKEYEVLHSKEYSNSRLTLVKKNDIYLLYEGRNLTYKKPDEKYWKLGQILSGEEKILLINGGLAGALQELLRQKGIEKITYVESDPGAAEVMNKFFGEEIKSSSKVDFFIGDPVLLLNNRPMKNEFDAAAIVFTGRGSIKNNRMHCSQFVDLVRNSVKKNGTVLIDNGHGSWVVASEERACIYEVENRLSVRKQLNKKDGFWAGVFAVILFLSGYLLFSRKNGKERCGADCLALLVIVFCVFLFQTAVLFIFQGLYGLLYKSAGMMLAFFAAGIVFGTSLVFIFENRIRISMIMIGAMILAVSIFFFIMNFNGFETKGTHNIVIAFMVFSGMLSGAAVSRVIEQRKHFAVHGIEYIGAAAGAAAAGAYLLPVLGFLSPLAVVFAVLLIMFLFRVGTSYKIKHSGGKNEGR